MSDGPDASPSEGDRDLPAAVDTAGVDLQWDVDPIDVALQSSAAAGLGELPTPFCLEVGRRVLLAEMEFSTWVLRRVETVSLGEGRSVFRKTTIEFKVRDDAPVFQTGAIDDGPSDTLWLVPLAIMKRRTLVDFHLANEDGTPLTLPGLRLTQRLDESVLLAAAATAGPPGSEVREFVRQVVAGDRRTAAAAIKRYESGRCGPELSALREHTLFAMTLDRLRYNFTLYVLLKHDRGRHRLLNMSFVEPIAWRYQFAKLKQKEPGRWVYRPMNPARWNLSHLASELGLAPTRVRFQTPAAENAASYHLELVTPPGVRIVDATLLAGRPHMPSDRITLDHQRGYFLTVGLHGVEVPPNSLCRTQVQLRVHKAGWLTTLLITTLAIFLVLLSVAWHAQRQDSPAPDQYTNVIVLLITTAAAAAAFLSQRDFTGVAARMLTGMRTVGAVAMALPIVLAGFLAYENATRPESVLIPRMPEPADVWTKWASWILSAVALVLFLLVFTTWWRTRSDERKAEVPSPWDQSWMARPDLQEDERRNSLTYKQALTKYGFDRKAVGVRSSEGWHHVYRWTGVDHAGGIKGLRRLDVVHDGCPVRARPRAGSAPAGGTTAPAPDQRVRDSSARAASAFSKQSCGGWTRPAPT
jgi:hypothetical protein